MTRTTGTSGKYAKGLARTYGRQAASYRLTSLGAVLIVIAGAIVSGGSLAVIAGGAVVALPVHVYCSKKARALSIQRRKAAVGAKSEKVVASILSSSTGAAYVLNGVHPGGFKGDCDHIVIGPYLTVVETKTGTGRVSSSHAGFMYVNRRQIPRDPIGQSLRQAAQVEKVSGVECDAIVCVPGMTNKPFTVTRNGKPVVICGKKNLASCIRRLPHRVPSRSEARSVRAKLIA